MNQPAAFTLTVFAMLLAAAFPTGAAGGEVATEVIAIEAPKITLAGRVLEKDGVTPVPGAEVSLTSRLDGEEHRQRAGRNGRFRARVPAGEYDLKIQKRLDIFTATSTYMLRGGERIRIDFLLLPDFEAPSRAGSPPPGPAQRRRGPDERRTAAAVVGTVVDITREQDRPRAGRWFETLGFIGSVLAVALAAL